MSTDANPGTGQIVEINISPEYERLPMPVQRVMAVAGRGLEGDRYFRADGEPGEKPDEEITLIAVEALEDFERGSGIKVTPAESRRQVATRGIDLNALVGKRFNVGPLVCEGIELCEPCTHLEGLTQPGVLKGLVHRGGLRASILSGGEIAVGDEVAEVG
jgi:MOSC domain-containing protein YiiM